MTKTEQAIELSNAAARLLSVGGSTKAHNLAEDMIVKAHGLLVGENAGRVRDIREGNVTIGSIEIGYCDDGSVWLTADGEGGSFRKDEFEAAILQFIKERI